MHERGASRHRVQDIGPGRFLRMGNHQHGDVVTLGEFLNRLEHAAHVDGVMTVDLASHVARDRVDDDEPHIADCEYPFAEPIKVGIIGLDTSHAPAFTKIFNDPKAQPDVAGFRVVAAYPKGSPDIESSVKRVPQYTADMQKLGVESRTQAVIAAAKIAGGQWRQGTPTT